MTYKNVFMSVWTHIIVQLARLNFRKRFLTYKFLLCVGRSDGLITATKNLLLTDIRLTYLFKV